METFNLLQSGACLLATANILGSVAVDGGAAIGRGCGAETVLRLRPAADGGTASIG